MQGMSDEDQLMRVTVRQRVAQRFDALEMDRLANDIRQAFRDGSSRYVSSYTPRGGVGMAPHIRGYLSNTFGGQNVCVGIDPGMPTKCLAIIVSFV